MITNSESVLFQITKNVTTIKRLEQGSEKKKEM